jgi:hypothetical protein
MEPREVKPKANCTVMGNQDTQENVSPFNQNTGKVSNV